MDLDLTGSSRSCSRGQEPHRVVHCCCAHDMRLELRGVDGLPEITPGMDLGGLIAKHAAPLAFRATWSW